MAVVNGDGRRAPERTVALWNPTLLDPETVSARSALGEAAAMIAELVARDLRMTASAGRTAAEVIHRVARGPARARLATRSPLPGRLHAGAAPRARAAAVGGRAAGVVATNALELGIDIGMLDCADLDRLPRHRGQPAAAVGPRRSPRRRPGGAGRRPDALDQYFIRHPAMLTGRPVEAAILDHASPEFSPAHLARRVRGADHEADDAILGGGAYAEAAADGRAGDARRAA